MPTRAVQVAAGDSADIRIDDIELVPKDVKGDKSWLAECQISNRLRPKTLVLLRWSSHSFAVLEQLIRGTTVRRNDCFHYRRPGATRGQLYEYTDLIVISA